MPARRLFPAELVDALGDPGLVARPQAWRLEAEARLAGLGVAPDPRHARLLEVVSVMLADRSLLTVEGVARRCSTTPRTLQRWFTHYVGVGPKWVLARYRMHDLVSELDAGYDGPLTDLAHRFGWYDQAHLTRDFTALVGVSPGRYRERVAPPRPGGGPGGRPRGQRRASTHEGSP